MAKGRNSEVAALTPLLKGGKHNTNINNNWSSSLREFFGLN
jgi:hypothetical protein